MAPSITTLALVVVHAAMGSLKITDAARMYARRSLVDQAATANADDRLLLDAGLSWPTLQLQLDYEPRVTFVDIFGPQPAGPLWLQSAAARLTLHEPRYSLSLTQTGSFGEQELIGAGVIAAPQLPQTSSAAPQAQAGSPAQPMPAQPTTTPPAMAPTLNLLPSARSIRIADEETAASLTALWSRRWQSYFRASFGFLGGADPAARSLLPRQRRAQLASSVSYDMSRRDQLGTVLSGAQIETSNGYDHWLASLAEAWATRWTSATRSELSLGVAFSDSTSPSAASSSRWGPIASASLMHESLFREMHVHMQIGVGYAPDVNVLLGRLQNRLQTSALLGVELGPVAARLLLGAAQTIPAHAPYAVTVATAALNVEYGLLQWLSAQTGAQLARQAFAGANSGTTWLAYAGLEARASEVRF